MENDHLKSLLYCSYLYATLPRLQSRKRFSRNKLKPVGYCTQGVRFRQRRGIGRNLKNTCSARWSRRGKNLHCLDFISPIPILENERLVRVYLPLKPNVSVDGPRL